MRRRLWDAGVGALAMATVVAMATLLHGGTLRDTIVVTVMLLGWCGVFCFIGFAWGADIRRAQSAGRR